MYKLLTVKEEVRVTPENFGLDVEEAIKKSLETQLEGKLNPDEGVYLAVTDVLSVGEGKIKPNDGAIFYPAKIKILSYKPEENEVIMGEVVDLTEFGAFVRMGPLDGLVHVSQISNEKMNYDPKNAVFSSAKTKMSIKEGTLVRTRVVSVSLGKARRKIGLTMRQPCLGPIEWLEAQKKNTKKKTGGKK
jgi:DNA-directed RNA polymerase subunit E'